MDFRKSDPYCKFRFTDIVKKSTVKRGELNPTWAESFIFKIADQSAEMPVGGKKQMHFLLLATN
jgi:Ca2+-dependent lipid-binding protein